MKQKNAFIGFAAGISLGMGSILAMGAFEIRLGVDSSDEKSESVFEVDLPRRQEGIYYVGDQTVLATPQTRIEDLPVLVDTENVSPNRYQVVDLDEDEGFVLVDTTTGLTRQFSKGRVTVYNPRVPNHAASALIRYHSVPTKPN